jgi:alpha-galactosidase
MDPQQWYPGGFPNGTGTWEPDPAKYPRGLKPIGDAARANGLQYLLWFEPERVAPGTRIDREHPEWVMKLDDGSRLFCFHDAAARSWLLDYVDVQISLAQLGWVRWDFNIQPLGFWRANDPEDRQGITEIRHLEGLYDFWDTLRRRHPGLVIDNCASGGRRLDIEACRRGLPLWHSDLQCNGPSPAADQLQNAGLNRWLPMHGCGNFGYEPAYAFRSAMTAGNILCSKLYDPGAAEAVKRTVALYHRVRPLMLGDFYPLLPESADEDRWFGWQYHRADTDAGFVLLFRREKCPDSSLTVAIRAVARDGQYRLDLVDAGATKQSNGQALAALTVTVPTAPGSALVFYERQP